MIPQHVIDELTAYGYSLVGSSIVHPSGKESGVYLERKGPRIQARVVATDALLWSGALISNFLESFWYATRKAQT